MTMTYLRTSTLLVAIAASLGLTVACTPKDGDTETADGGTDGTGTDGSGADGTGTAEESGGGSAEAGGTSGGMDDGGTTGMDAGSTSGDGDGDGDICSDVTAKLVECGSDAREANQIGAECEAEIEFSYGKSAECGDATVALYACFAGLECEEFEGYYVCEAESYAFEIACYGGGDYGDYGETGYYDTGVDTGFDGGGETGVDTGNPGTGGGPTGGGPTGGGPTGG